MFIDFKCPKCDTTAARVSTPDQDGTYKRSLSFFWSVIGFILGGFSFILAFFMRKKPGRARSLLRGVFWLIVFTVGVVLAAGGLAFALHTYGYLTPFLTDLGINIDLSFLGGGGEAACLLF